MITVFQQIFILIIFAFIGYALCKFKIANVDHTKILSVLGVYVFLPATIFRSFALNFTVEYITRKYHMLIIAAVLLAVLAVVLHFVTKLLTKDSYKQAIYHYSLLIPNYSYMGFALTSALFGEEMLLNVMVFTFPLTLYVHLIAVPRLKKSKYSPKHLCDPCVISILLGTVVGLSGIRLPSVVTTLLNNASACMAPISMLMTGMVISEFGISAMLKRKTTYIITILRLVVIPSTLALVLRPICPVDAVTVAIIVFCLPCGMNTVVFPKLVGENCEDGASLAIVSNILSCITIPLCINFLL